MPPENAIEAGSALVADGVSGMRLQDTGLSMEKAPERWTLENLPAVRALAEGCANKRSDIVCTNTFGGSVTTLRLSGLDGRIAEINEGAVRLAGEAIAASGRRFVLVASIGPPGEMLDPYGDLSADEARDSFACQAHLLKEAGVDEFTRETLTGLEKALLCVGPVKQIADGLPAFDSMAFKTSGRTMLGVQREGAAPELCSARADVVGGNCRIGPEVVEKAVGAMAPTVPDQRLLGKPNAGLPRVDSERTAHSLSPEGMGASASRVTGVGARVLGGCCGRRPAHIRAICDAVDPL